MTSPHPDSDRPADAADGAWYDAVVTEHGVIYGYGLVSARSAPELNPLVAEAMAEHRARREAALAVLAERSVPAPLPAAGYELPMAVDESDDAVQLAVQMESDTAVAWRAVLEQATTTEDRSFAVEALTASAVLAARWRRTVNEWPVTEPFPGGTE